jgi:hypothetical protein
LSDADATVALLPGQADHTAVAAVGGIGSRIGAARTALGQTLRSTVFGGRRRGSGAEAGLARLARGAGDVAEAAVDRITVEVGANAATVNFTVSACLPTAASADAVDAVYASRAGIEAVTAVGGAGHQIGAVAAVGLPRRTRSPANTVDAVHPSRARLLAGAAVLLVIGQVDADPAAIGLPRRSTGGCLIGLRLTGAADTCLTRSTLKATETTIAGIRRHIDTDTVA